MTKSFLEGKIQSVFDDFEQERWCNLNTNGFSYENYQSKVNQQKYIIKYYGAYFCELYGMFGKFLNSYTEKDLNILSIGCGSGVDCEALNRVCIDQNRVVNKRYVGIDIVDWNYRPDFQWSSFKTISASNLDSSDVENVDLFVFPKSLTELPEDIRVHIGNTITTYSKKDIIYFINTYVTNNPTNPDCVDGISQFSKINKILNDNSWECSSEPSVYYYKKDSGWLGYNFDFFKIPDEVSEFVSELKDSCNNHNNSKMCLDCDIDFWPIFTSKYLAYNLLIYTRG
ncbi:hypothetical protein [Klebsiella spallanzanii]|uniref:Uncharacterized protein n=1 Tax=Klebsiella spallanzanii TaxID=2587528 RepID=A0A564N2A7_9ENTR|nr:hypothetical protein [Klebsiella spallanzanii]VUT00291.1 hypothetical protein SB6408_01897 [Klebsiella spallanzanii]